MPIDPLYIMGALAFLAIAVGVVTVMWALPPRQSPVDDFLADAPGDMPRMPEGWLR